MTNAELEQLARELRLQEPAQTRLRLAFGHACAQRVSQHLEQDEAITALRDFGAYLDGTLSEPAFAELQARIGDVANRHAGSRSLDGSQHAAVSATYALAKAIQGRALEAAAYAAYSKVYGYGGYAVSDPTAYAEEHQAQVSLLRALALAPRGL